MSRRKIDEWITEDGLLQITGWIRDGLTIEDVAITVGEGAKRPTVGIHPEEGTSFGGISKKNITINGEPL